MAQRLAHRGPDGYSAHQSGPLAFGAGRLAIIDLAAPPGVIFNEDHCIAVAFNGEIYNYRALRAELEKLGHHFTTHTDTEVIVHGYESWGDQVIERLRGMFGLALWDENRQRLLLARDRAGEKPLYFALLDGEFLFSSEIKAFQEHPAFHAEVNTEALTSYLALGYIPAPHTLFRGVEKLFPGERISIDRHTLRRERYWQPVMDTRQRIDYAEAVRRVREKLIEIVEMRLMSDVPIGAFLSGGVDSTAVVGIMARALNQPVNTFTVGFDLDAGSQDDAKFNADARFATLAAEHFKTHHHAITIQPDESLAALLPQLVYAMDEPVAQQSIFQTPYVAALARSHGVPVLLTGDGGDELFAGYTHFRADQVLERYLRLPALLRNSVLTPLLERLPSDSAHKLARKSRITDPVKRYLEWKRMIALEQMPDLMTDQTGAGRAYDAVSAALLPLLNAPRTDHFADRIAMAGFASWLAEDSNMRVDKMTMAMSIEARAPFEDHEMIALAFGLPLEHKLRRGDFKAALKDAVADFVPRPILERPKWGFAPPTSQWLRTTLRPLVDRYLAPDYVRAVGLFRAETVADLVDRHIHRREYHVWALWTLLIFHLWHALYIDHSLTLAQTLSPADLIVG
jgi:asparagine synthase (glutamine-hydrolysing)